MLSIYVPLVYTGTNANPRACVGDLLYEWGVNNTSSGSNTLTRIRKDTYTLTDTVTLPSNQCQSIAIGGYQGTDYIFTSSGVATGNIYRVNSSGNNPATTLFSIALTKTDISRNVCCSAITYSNGYLWVVPNTTSGITGTIIRMNIFNNLTKNVYSYTSTITDPQLTVYTEITMSTTVSNIYAFGNFIFTISNGTPATVISKLSTLLPATTGVISPTKTTFTYNGMYLNSIASDNINYIWMSESSGSSGRIYRMSLNYNQSITESTPTIAVTQFTSTLKSISVLKYGAGYLWASGTAVNGNSPTLVQIDVATNTIANVIPLISTSTSGVTNPVSSTITSIDISSEYMWLTDNGNSALLKMKIYIPCFREGTKILCLNAQMKEEYIPIENIRKGQLVKTSQNGFVPVCMIGKKTISNPGTNDRIKNRLYKCTQDKYPELFEDLYITGCHSILVDKLTDEQREQTLESLGDIYVTDRKYRLMAYLDERSEPYTETGIYPIWHFALEHKDYLMNYGIFANGLLVESTSKRYMKELSGMDLID